MADREFEGHTAVITGAAMGIGKACAEAFARGGAAVVIADVDVEAGRAAASAIEAAGGRALFVETDVCRMGDMERMRDAALAAFGGIDILVNNAARAIGGRVDEIEEADWERVISNNLTSV